MSTIDDEEEEDKKASMQFPTSMQNGLFIFPPNNNNNRREEQKLPGFPRSVEEKIIDEKGQEVMVARMERSDRPRFEYKVRKFLSCQHEMDLTSSLSLTRALASTSSRPTTSCLEETRTQRQTFPSCLGCPEAETRETSGRGTSSSAESPTRCTL